ncbi:MAG: HDOD domain-containing protein [Bacteroidetes bacterium]|nr:MAG: HDOD domain-containing protein [Bacteroidota bacterium]
MAEDDRSIPATQFPQEPSFDLRFPPLPSTVAEVTRLLTQDSGEPDVQRLADIVNADLVVAASVLRRVNSAYYGLRRRIGDVRQAVFLLGYLEVCNIVLTAGMMKLRDVVSNDEQTTIFDQILCRSIGAAYYTRKLATLLDLAQASSAFTIGLLQPIGRLVLLYNRPDDYEALWFNGGACLPPSVEQERSIFGTDYTAVGAMALEEWQLPQAYCDVLRHYLVPGRLEEPTWRPIALALTVGMAATEQLCLSASPVRTSSFKPGPTLPALLRTARSELTAEEVVTLLEREQQQVRTYIDEMMQP